METKRLIQLLELVKLDFINNNTIYQYGICKSISNVFYNDDYIISPKEYKYVLDYIQMNKPTKYNQYKHYTESEYWIKDGAYWWFVNSKTKQIRIDYLNALINNLK